MIDPKEIESFFVDRLSPILAPLPVKPFPNVSDIKDFANNVNSAIGAVTIAMRRIQNVEAHEGGSDFAYYPQFNVFSASLRADATGHHGAYEAIVLIANSIHEKRFTIGGEIFKCAVSDSYYVGRDEDLFAYAIDAVLLPKLSHI